MQGLVFRLMKSAKSVLRSSRAGRLFRKRWREVCVDIIWIHSGWPQSHTCAIRTCEQNGLIGGGDFRWVLFVLIIEESIQNGTRSTWESSVLLNLCLCLT